MQQRCGRGKLFRAAQQILSPGRTESPAHWTIISSTEVRSRPHTEHIELTAPCALLGVFRVTFAPVPVVELYNWQDQLRTTHGILMTVGWGGFLTAGIFIARYLKGYSWWYASAMPVVECTADDGKHVWLCVHV